LNIRFPKAKYSNVTWQIIWLIYSKHFVLKPDWLFLFHSMKRKQKSCQNEPSAGRFDGPPARIDQEFSFIEKIKNKSAPNSQKPLNPPDLHRDKLGRGL
jgi:hypothetical protein